LRQQVSRIDDVCKIITSMCIDSNELKNNGISYIHNNEESAHDVMNFMNGMRSRLESLLKVDLNSVGEFPNPSCENDNVEDENDEEFTPSPDTFQHFKLLLTNKEELCKEEKFC
jgi:hypothetical protein